MSVALGGFSEVRSNTWGNETHLKLIKPYQSKRTPVSHLHVTSHLEGSGHGPLHLSSMAASHRVEKNLRALGGFVPTRLGVAKAEAHPHPPLSAPTDYAEPRPGDKLPPCEICNPASGGFDVGWYQSPNYQLHCTSVRRDRQTNCARDQAELL